MQEAEHTLVVTPAQAHLLKVEAKRFPLSAFNLKFVGLILTLDLKDQVLFGTGYLKVNQILYVCVIDPDDPIAIAESCPFSKCPRFDHLDGDQGSILRAIFAGCNDRRRLLAVT